MPQVANDHSPAAPCPYHAAVLVEVGQLVREGRLPGGGRGGDTAGRPGSPGAEFVEAVMEALPLSEANHRDLASLGHERAGSRALRAVCILRGVRWSGELLIGDVARF